MPKSTSVIVGMGEIGNAFYEILSEKCRVYGYDIIEGKRQGKSVEKCDILHICLPHHEDFVNTVLKYHFNFRPQELIIHSSVKPGTTEELWRLLYSHTKIAYSPWRGVHSRMTEDMKRYTKYWASSLNMQVPLFLEQMKQCGIKTEEWQGMTSLELAKLWMDVVYYGWLIIFAQHTKVLADRFGVDEKKLWDFTDEIHRFLGNRPRMFSGEGIGGHCVMSDVDLLNDSFLDAVFSHDKGYRRNLKIGR